MYPSIKTLMTLKDVTREDAIAIREIMAGHRAIPCRGCGRLNDIGSVDPYPFNMCGHFHDGRHRYSRMAAIDVILGTFGVEYQERGSNAKSPAFYYCNAGDAYARTILGVNGRFCVGCWGDIVERGNYR